MTVQTLIVIMAQHWAAEVSFINKGLLNWQTLVCQHMSEMQPSLLVFQII